MKPIYETNVDHGKLVFKITQGQFTGVSYVYESLSLNGNLQYKLKANKSTINDTNRILFEQEIRGILKDKLNHLKPNSSEN